MDFYCNDTDCCIVREHSAIKEYICGFKKKIQMPMKQSHPTVAHDK